MTNRRTRTSAKPKPTHVYEFPALRGIQAEKEFYSCVVPIPIVAKIFLFNEEEVPVEMRVQRELNQSRANKIRDYVIENPKSYVLPSLTASIDGDCEFIPVAENSHIGILRSPIAARYILNDGQHRRAGLAMALKDNPELADESIAVLFFIDLGLKRSQQIFSDINSNAKTPDSNINLTFDHRDPDAVLTRNVIQKVEFLRQYVQNEGGSIKKASGKLFLRKWIYDANKRLCTSVISVSDREAFCIGFWNALYANIPEWQQIQEHKLAAFDVRTDYISGCAITLNALSQIGSDLAVNDKYAKNPEKLIELFAPLADINWHKLASDWHGMVIEPGTGKVMTQKHNIELMVEFIKEKLH